MTDYREMQRRNNSGLMESIEVRAMINKLEASERLIKEQYEDNVDAVAKMDKAESRVKELEHWFHGYRTPELSMSAMETKITELEGKLEGVDRFADKAESVLILLWWLW